MTDKKKSMYSGTAMKYKAKKPELMGNSYGLADSIAGVSNKFLLLSTNESLNIEGDMGKVIIGKNKVNDRN
jgi:hypothetical protein